MTNMNKNENQKPENMQKLQAEIKKTWSKLSDEEIKLSETDRKQFFTVLKDKQGVSMEDAEKKMQEMEKSCGCGASCGSKNTDASKAA